MSQFNTFDLDEFIDNLPAGLDRAILRVLSFHKGRDQAIGRSNLVNELWRVGFKVQERAARAQISQLRKAGHLIGSAAGENGGYFLIASAEEFNDFVQQEYAAKIADMQSTLSAMRLAAEKQWGKLSPSRQPSLFG